jgi:hypothetical protein
MYAFLILPKCSTFPFYITFLHLIRLIIFVNEHKYKLTHNAFFSVVPILPLVWAQNSQHLVLKHSQCIMCPSLRVGDPVSHQHTSKVKFQAVMLASMKVSLLRFCAV